VSAVDRFCFVRLAADHHADRVAVAAELRAAFEGLDGVIEVSAGVPADDSAAKWDVSLVVRCRDLAAWQAIAALPLITALFEVELPARAAVVKAWTFAVVAAAES
jgi:hypothetical protein